MYYESEVTFKWSFHFSHNTRWKSGHLWCLPLEQQLIFKKQNSTVYSTLVELCFILSQFRPLIVPSKQSYTILSPLASIDLAGSSSAKLQCKASFFGKWRYSEIIFVIDESYDSRLWKVYRSPDGRKLNQRTTLTQDSILVFLVGLTPSRGFLELWTFSWKALNCHFMVWSVAISLLVCFSIGLKSRHMIF